MDKCDNNNNNNHNNENKSQANLGEEAAIRTAKPHAQQRQP